MLWFFIVTDMKNCIFHVISFCDIFRNINFNRFRTKLVGCIKNIEI